ncbi:DUF2634 domain-containing protein [Megasphaera elsdenii]|uniref:DUF2634 domain-containing protein n=1 Tax=Megasphaera elsdenii TaxID=907 RepID=A0A848ETN0_MEGEL|nr:DUF2634 domain-containing protein [Megasphaera elsdenii]NMK40038.1 DUF2634 domain-containing protein [Megasphaera elsdenii]
MSVEYPFTGTVTANTYTSDLPTPKEYAWDFENDCFLYDADGRLKIVEGDEAIKIWIYKALSTERFRYLAYSWQYGIELRPFIGKVMGVQQRYSEIKRVIVECLMVNPYIKSIDTIDIQHEGDTVDISITLTTIYGEVSVDV